MKREKLRLTQRKHSPREICYLSWFLLSSSAPCQPWSKHLCTSPCLHHFDETCSSMPSPFWWTEPTETVRQDKPSSSGLFLPAACLVTTQRELTSADAGTQDERWKAFLLRKQSIVFGLKCHEGERQGLQKCMGVFKVLCRTSRNPDVFYWREPLPIAPKTRERS